MIKRKLKYLYFLNINIIYGTEQKISSEFLHMNQDIDTEDTKNLFFIAVIAFICSSILFIKNLINTFNKNNNKTITNQEEKVNQEANTSENNNAIITNQEEKIILGNNNEIITKKDKNQKIENIYKNIENTYQKIEYHWKKILSQFDKIFNFNKEVKFMIIFQLSSIISLYYLNFMTYVITSIIINIFIYFIFKEDKNTEELNQKLKDIIISITNKKESIPTIYSILLETLKNTKINDNKEFQKIFKNFLYNLIITSDDYTKIDTHNKQNYIDIYIDIISLLKDYKNLLGIFFENTLPSLDNTLLSEIINYIVELPDSSTIFLKLLESLFKIKNYSDTIIKAILPHIFKNKKNKNEFLTKIENYFSSDNILKVIKQMQALNLLNPQDLKLATKLKKNLSLQQSLEIIDGLKKKDINYIEDITKDLLGKIPSEELILNDSVINFFKNHDLYNLCISFIKKLNNNNYKEYEQNINIIMSLKNLGNNQECLKTFLTLINLKKNNKFIEEVTINPIASTTDLKKYYDELLLINCIKNNCNDDYFSTINNILAKQEVYQVGLSIQKFSLDFKIKFKEFLDNKNKLITTNTNNVKLILDLLTKSINKDQESNILNLFKKINNIIATLILSPLNLFKTISDLLKSLPKIIWNFLNNLFEIIKNIFIIFTLLNIVWNVVLYCIFKEFLFTQSLIISVILIALLFFFNVVKDLRVFIEKNNWLSKLLFDDKDLTDFKKNLKNINTSIQKKELSTIYNKLLTTLKNTKKNLNNKEYQEAFSAFLKKIMTSNNYTEINNKNKEDYKNIISFLKDYENSLGIFLKNTSEALSLLNEVLLLEIINHILNLTNNSTIILKLLESLFLQKNYSDEEMQKILKIIFKSITGKDEVLTKIESFCNSDNILQFIKQMQTLNLLTVPEFQLLMKNLKKKFSINESLAIIHCSNLNDKNYIKNITKILFDKINNFEEIKLENITNNQTKFLKNYDLFTYFSSLIKKLNNNNYKNKSNADIMTIIISLKNLGNNQECVKAFLELINLNKYDDFINKILTQNIDNVANLIEPYQDLLLLNCDKDNCNDDYFQKIYDILHLKQSHEFDAIIKQFTKDFKIKFKEFLFKKNFGIIKNNIDFKLLLQKSINEDGKKNNFFSRFLS
jgi:hypothetical protein